MEIRISLSEEDIRLCKEIVADQTHLTGRTGIEDAVIYGILTQISKKNIAIAKAKKHFAKEDEDHWSTQEFINDLYDNDSPIGESI
jgi:hypothetical protein